MYTYYQDPNEEVRNILVQMFVSDTVFPFPQGLTPDIVGLARYGYGLAHRGFVRPHYWKDSLGYSLQASTCSGTPLAFPGTLPPCVIDIARTTVFDDANHGPYFLHVWAWKEVHQEGTPPIWKPIIEPEFKVSPYFGLVDPSTGNLLSQKMKPILSNPVAVYNGLAVVPFTNEMITTIWRDILKQQGGPPQIPGVGTLPGGSGLDLKFELPYGAVILPNLPGWKKFYQFESPKADHIVNYIQDTSNEQYANALCGAVVPNNWCECAEEISSTPIPSTYCGNICRCIDPIGANIAATGGYPGCLISYFDCQPGQETLQLQYRYRQYRFK